MTHQEENRLNLNTLKILKLELQKIRYIRSLSFIQGTTVHFMRTLVVFTLYYFVFQGKIVVGDLLTMTFFTFFIFNPLQEMSQFIIVKNETKVSLDNFKNLLEKESEYKPAQPTKIGTIEKLTFSNVSFQHQTANFKAVEHINFEIKKGETVAFVGPSGSGKTTVLRMIAGFEKPDSGSIFISDKDVSQLAPYVRDVNTVFQDYALFPHMDVVTNIEYGLRVKGIEKSERRTRALHALEQVRLSGFEDRKPSQLSGGQRQRVALARALVNRPSVLLLDEPLGALDLKLREQMQFELKELQRAVGITFIFVTHDQEEALTMSDRIAVFNQGKIEQLGTPAEIYSAPQTAFVSEFVGQINKLDMDGARINVRPEHISTSKNVHNLGRSVNGVVRDIIFAGAITRYLIDTDKGFSLISTKALDALNVGDPVTASWEREKEFHVQK